MPSNGAGGRLKVVRRGAGDPGGWRWWDRPGTLLESTTLYCLNEPSVPADTTWIHPGKITFHWWNGDVFDGKPGPPMLSVAMNRAYMISAPRRGFQPFHPSSTEGVTLTLVSSIHSGVAPGPRHGCHATTGRFRDLEAIRSYMRTREGPGFGRWVHQGALRGRVEGGLCRLRANGVVRTDGRFSTMTIRSTWVRRGKSLEAAGRHHLLVQLHGIWKPTGLERTFPNLVNHGALNQGST